MSSTKKRILKMGALGLGAFFTYNFTKGALQGIKSMKEKESQAKAENILMPTTHFQANSTVLPGFEMQPDPHLKFNATKTINDLLVACVVNDANYEAVLLKKYPNKMSTGAYHKVFGNEEGVLKIFTVMINLIGVNLSFGGTESANALVHMYFQKEGIVPPSVDPPLIIQKNETIMIYVTSSRASILGQDLIDTNLLVRPTVPFVFWPFEFVKTLSGDYYRLCTNAVHKLIGKMLNFMSKGIHFGDNIALVHIDKYVVPYIMNANNVGLIVKKDEKGSDVVTAYLLDVDFSGDIFNKRETVEGFSIDDKILELVTQKKSDFFGDFAAKYSAGKRRKTRALKKKILDKQK